MKPKELLKAVFLRVMPVLRMVLIFFTVVWAIGTVFIYIASQNPAPINLFYNSPALGLLFFAGMLLLTGWIIIFVLYFLEKSMRSD